VSSSLTYLLAQLQSSSNNKNFIMSFKAFLLLTIILPLVSGFCPSTPSIKQKNHVGLLASVSSKEEDIALTLQTIMGNIAPDQEVVKEEEKKEEPQASAPQQELKQAAEAPAPAAPSTTTTANDENTVCKGTVKWFDLKKGYGFIEREGDHENFFVHQTEIQAEGFRSLDDGADVEFQIGTSANGRTCAVHVTGPGGTQLKRGHAYKKREEYS
jgi:cold shock CspA family protein